MEKALNNTRPFGKQYHTHEEKHLPKVNDLFISLVPLLALSIAKPDELNISLDCLVRQHSGRRAKGI